MEKTSAILLLIGLLVSGLQPAFAADTLTDEARLRKLSLRIRGMTPSPMEYQSLDRAIKNGRSDEFFKNKTQQYMQTNVALEKLLNHMEENMRFSIPVHSSLEATVALSQVRPDRMDEINEYAERVARGEIELNRFDIDEMIQSIAPASTSRDEGSGFVPPGLFGLSQRDIRRFEREERRQRRFAADPLIAYLRTRAFRPILARLLQQGKSWDAILNSGEFVLLGQISEIYREVKDYEGTIQGAIENNPSLPPEQAVAKAMTVEDLPERSDLVTEAEELLREYSNYIQDDYPREARGLLLLRELDYSQPDSYLTFLGGRFSDERVAGVLKGDLLKVFRIADEVAGSSDQLAYMLRRDRRFDGPLENARNGIARFFGAAPSQEELEEYRDRAQRLRAEVAPLGQGYFQIDTPFLEKNPELVTYLHQLKTPESEAEAGKVVDELIRRLSGHDSLEHLLSAGIRFNNLISSEAFKSRYDQTEYSRAAAFYRIYLCDDMQPAFSSSNNSFSETALNGLRGALDSSPQSQDMADQEAVEDQHVKTECQICHKKLDPVSEETDGDEPWQGPREFVYDTDNGKEKRFTAANPQEFMNKIFASEQYVRCQTKRMWDWYIGRDRNLSEKRHQELIKAFDERGRQAKDFIAYLVNQPEFYHEPDLNQPVRFDQVKPTLARCNSCHHSEAPLAPNLADIPFNFLAFTPEEKQKQHVKYLREIVKATNLFQFGKNAEMPPKKSAWVPRKEEYVDLIRWIEGGARDEQGEPTLSRDQVRTIFASAPSDIDRVIRPDELQAGFSNRWLRYMENNDLLKVLAQNFPFSFQYCADDISTSNTRILGFLDPSTGQPDSSAPTTEMQRWLNTCLMRVLEVDQQRVFTPLGQHMPDKQSFYGVDLLPEESLAQSTSQLDAAKNTGWSQLDSETQRIWINRVIHDLVGRKVLTDRKQSQMIARIQSGLDRLETQNALNLAQAGKYIPFLVISSDEFLTF